MACTGLVNSTMFSPGSVSVDDQLDLVIEERVHVPIEVQAVDDDQRPRRFIVALDVHGVHRHIVGQAELRPQHTVGFRRCGAVPDKIRNPGPQSDINRWTGQRRRRRFYGRR